VLAGAIAVIWAVMTVWPGGEKAGPVPQATVDPADVEPVQAATVDGPVQVTLSAGTTACDPQQVRVTPTVPADQQAGGEVEIDLVMSTTAEASCTLSPSDADLIAIISANDKAVWDSTVCKTSLLTAPVELTAGWATVVTTKWSGRGSGGSCSAKEGWAPGGDYVVRVGTLGGEPGKTSFDLAAAPKPKKTDEPDDKLADEKAEKSDG